MESPVYRTGVWIGGLGAGMAFGAATAAVLSNAPLQGWWAAGSVVYLVAVVPVLFSGRFRALRASNIQFLAFTAFAVVSFLVAAADQSLAAPAFGIGWAGSGLGLGACADWSRHGPGSADRGRSS